MFCSRGIRANVTIASATKTGRDITAIEVSCQVRISSKNPATNGLPSVSPRFAPVACTARTYPRFFGKVSDKKAIPGVLQIIRGSHHADQETDEQERLRDTEQKERGTGAQQRQHEEDDPRPDISTSGPLPKLQASALMCIIMLRSQLPYTRVRNPVSYTGKKIIIAWTQWVDAWPNPTR